MMLGILCLVLAYIAGSFPSGLVIGEALYHTDIRDYGSHNTGATNAYRVLGAVGGLLVLICDVAKGMLGVYLGQVASQSGLGSADTQIYFMIAGGLLAIVLYPIISEASRHHRPGLQDRDYFDDTIEHDEPLVPPPARRK